MREYVLNAKLFEFEGFRKLPDNSLRLGYLVLATRCDHDGFVADADSKTLFGLWLPFGCRSPAEADRWLEWLIEAELFTMHTAMGERSVRVRGYLRKFGR